ncbi:MAG: Na/Pi cotransporter family protein [Clostridiales bacterium]|jgi:phosphate:Na+ symporter|nr:Na/Pi cotransporter family protein [Clostridiales bacterium]
MQIVACVFLLFAGMGVLMLGMKLMSEGLERSAGRGMQNLLGRITNNRFKGMAVGATVTAVVHSSAACTVMVIGFVNAGILTLFQATAVILGANIGTTITGLMVSLESFNVSLYLGSVALVGVFMVMFAKKEKWQRLGQILTGVGMIFIGLRLMSGAFDTQEFNALLITFFNLPVFLKVPLLMAIVGMILTAVVQSSSAVNMLVISMTLNGVIPLECALFVVLGAEVGTCVTGLIASVGANVNAKRTALIQLLFNVLGSALFIAIIWIFKPQVVGLLTSLFPESAAAFRISVFQTVFNVVTVLMLLPFIKPFVRLVELLTPEKIKNPGVGAAEFHVDGAHFSFIDDRILQTPSIALSQVHKEILSMALEAKDNLDRGVRAVLTRDLSERDTIFEAESRINFVNRGVAHFLIKLSSASGSVADEEKIGTLHHVIADIERIGDHAINFFQRAEECINNDIFFTPDGLGEVRNIYGKMVKMFDVVVHVFETGDTSLLKTVSAEEDEIDTLRKTINNNHIARLRAGGCSVESGPVFYSLIAAIERVADHLTNIAFSVKSPTGSQHEAAEIMEKERR